MKEVNLKQKDETNGSVCLVDSIMTQRKTVYLHCDIFYGQGNLQGNLKLCSVIILLKAKLVLFS